MGCSRTVEARLVLMSINPLSFDSLLSVFGFPTYIILFLCVMQILTARRGQGPSDWIDWEDYQAGDRQPPPARVPGPLVTSHPPPARVPGPPEVAAGGRCSVMAMLGTWRGHCILLFEAPASPVSGALGGPSARPRPRKALSLDPLEQAAVDHLAVEVAVPVDGPLRALCTAPARTTQALFPVSFSRSGSDSGQSESD